MGGSLGKASLYFQLNVIEGCSSGAGSWREHRAKNRVDPSESRVGGRQEKGWALDSAATSFPRAACRSLPN